MKINFYLFKLILLSLSDDNGDDKSVKKDEIRRELLNFRKETQKPMTHECYNKSIGIESVSSQHKSKKYEVRKIAYKNYVERIYHYFLQ